LRVAGTGRAAFVQQVVSPRKRVENNLLDRTTLWTFASKLATVHHVAGQPGPLNGTATRMGPIIRVAVFYALGCTPY